MALVPADVVSDIRILSPAQKEAGPAAVTVPEGNGLTVTSVGGEDADWQPNVLINLTE